MPPPEGPAKIGGQRVVDEQVRVQVALQGGCSPTSLVERISEVRHQRVVPEESLWNSIGDVHLGQGPVKGGHQRIVPEHVLRKGIDGDAVVVPETVCAKVTARMFRLKSTLLIGLYPSPPFAADKPVAIRKGAVEMGGVDVVPEQVVGDPRDAGGSECPREVQDRSARRHKQLHGDHPREGRGRKGAGKILRQRMAGEKQRDRAGVFGCIECGIEGDHIHVRQEDVPWKHLPGGSQTGIAEGLLKRHHIGSRPGKHHRRHVAGDQGVGKGPLKGGITSVLYRKSSPYTR